MALQMSARKAELHLGGLAYLPCFYEGIILAAVACYACAYTAGLAPIATLKHKRNFKNGTHIWDLTQL